MIGNDFYGTVYFGTDKDLDRSFAVNQSNYHRYFFACTLRDQFNVDKDTFYLCNKGFSLIQHTYKHKAIVGIRFSGR